MFRNRFVVACLGLGLICLSCTAFAQFPHADFELVETIPVETHLDNEDIRDTLEVWLEMIRGAQRTLDIEQFYVSSTPGEPLEAVVSEILRAAERGVRVRFIADAGFYKTYPETLDLLGARENVEVRLIDFRALTGGVQHSKWFVVDGQQVFLGSQNFDWRALKHIHEIGIRMRHAEAAAAYLDLFELDWNLCEAKAPEATSPAPVRRQYALPFRIEPPGEEPIEFYPVWAPRQPSPDEALWNLRAILEALDASKQEVCIELLGYSPTDRRKQPWLELDDALRRAAVRGVKVRMICSDWSKRKPKIDALKSLALVDNLEVKLSTIPPHSSGFIPYARVTHAKFLTVDGERCWVGSSNWEKDYFYASRNVGVMIHSRKVTERLRAIFQKDWDSPYTYAVDPKTEYAPPRIGP